MKSRVSLDSNYKDLIACPIQERAIEFFHAHGAVWIENVFDPDWIDVLRDAYDERYTSRRVSDLKKKHAIVGDHRFMISVAVEPPFNDDHLYANLRLRPLLNTWLGTEHLISSFGSVVTFPAADAQPIHFDHPPLFEREADCLNLPPYAITLVVPLVDLDESTGTTAIWEGSHNRLGARKELANLMDQPTTDGASFPMAKKGDVYLMDYRVIHGGMPNLSDQARPILYIVYSRPWFRDSFNFRDQPAIDISKAQRKKIPKSYRGLFAAAGPQ